MPLHPPLPPLLAAALPPAHGPSASWQPSCWGDPTHKSVFWMQQSRAAWQASPGRSPLERRLIGATRQLARPLSSKQPAGGGPAIRKCCKRCWPQGHARTTQMPRATLHCTGQRQAAARAMWQPCWRRAQQSTSPTMKASLRWSWLFSVGTPLQCWPCCPVGLTLPRCNPDAAAAAGQPSDALMQRRCGVLSWHSCCGWSASGRRARPAPVLRPAAAVVPAAAAVRVVEHGRTGQLARRSNQVRVSCLVVANW